MRWKPAPWIAAALSLIVAPLGMLYVQRPRLAGAYFLASVAAGIATFLSLWAFAPGAMSGVSLAGWIISITCAVHAFRMARAALPVERKWYSRWYALTGIPVAVLGSVIMFRSFVYEPFNAPSDSMYPTIPAHSIMVVEKSGFGDYGTLGIQFSRKESTRNIARGDIVVHRLVSNPSIRYVSRVIGIPGDHIQYVNSQLIINGVQVPTRIEGAQGQYQLALEELDGRNVSIAYIPDRKASDFDQVVPAGEYIVFGDSRDNARDSRYIGPVPRANISGRVTKIYPPPAWSMGNDR
jgi:signal peptidase I